jgi:hypothetical protein
MGRGTSLNQVLRRELQLGRLFFTVADIQPPPLAQQVAQLLHAAEPI